MKTNVPVYLQNYPFYYMGNKSKWTKHIHSVMPKNTGTFIDICGGTMLSGYSVKKVFGARIISNDILKYSCLKGKVFVANNKTLLSYEDLEMLKAPNENRGDAACRWYGHFLGKENATLLDNWASNIKKLTDPVKVDIATLLPVLCANRRFQYSAVHFDKNHMPSGGMNLFKIDLEKEVIDFAKNILPTLVFDNGQENQVYNMDGVELIKKVAGDVLFFDPAFVGGGGNYHGHYAFWDKLISIMSDKAHEVDDPYDDHCNLPAFTKFHQRRSALLGFAEIFKNAKHIPLVILTYDTTSGIAIAELENIAKVYGRHVTTKIYDCLRPTTTGGNGASTELAIIVCANDPNFKPPFYKPEQER